MVFTTTFIAWDLENTTAQHVPEFPTAKVTCYLFHSASLHFLIGSITSAHYDLTLHIVLAPARDQFHPVKRSI